MLREMKTSSLLSLQHSHWLSMCNVSIPRMVASSYVIITSGLEIISVTNDTLFIHSFIARRKLFQLASNLWMLKIDNKFASSLLTICSRLVGSNYLTVVDLKVSDFSKFFRHTAPCLIGSQFAQLLVHYNKV